MPQLLPVSSPSMRGHKGMHLRDIRPIPEDRAGSDYLAPQFEQAHAVRYTQYTLVIITRHPDSSLVPCNNTTPFSSSFYIMLQH